MLGAIRASVYYACSLPFASAAAMPCYASTWQLTRQPISSFAFAMHSMAHPRRTPRRANFGRWRPQRRLICRSDTHPLSRRSADPRTPISRWSDWRGGRSVACARSLRTRDFCGLSRERGTNSERAPHGHDPRTLFYRRSRELSG